VHLISNTGWAYFTCRKSKEKMLLSIHAFAIHTKWRFSNERHIEKNNGIFYGGVNAV
jgi:hypothetical protein